MRWPTAAAPAPEPLPLPHRDQDDGETNHGTPRALADRLHNARLALSTPRATALPPCFSHQPHGRCICSADLLGGGLRRAVHLCLRALQDGRVLRRALPAVALARAQAALQGA